MMAHMWGQSVGDARRMFMPDAIGERRAIGKDFVMGGVVYLTILVKYLDIIIPIWNISRTRAMISIKAR